MPGLPETARKRYFEQGYLAPLPVLERDEVTQLRDHILALGAARGGKLPPALNMKAHLLIPSLWRLVHSPRIVGPVVDLLGEDVLCWGSSFFDKCPGSAEHVRWHQDSTYWGLERADALTVWVALTRSDTGNGCLRVVPGSHGEQMRHVHAGDQHNMLAGGEKLLAPVAEQQAVDIVLEPGEASIHHQQLVHGSNRNLGSERRMGFAIRYIAGDLRGLQRDFSYATLVHGRDLGGFQIETGPRCDFDSQALRRHSAILRKTSEIVRREIARHVEEGENAPC